MRSTATGEGDAGVEHGAELMTFAEAVVGGDATAIADSRDRLRPLIGDDGFVEAAAVVAAFNMLDRIADATGIAVDRPGGEFREAVAAEMGIEHFAAE